jgi:endonuclease/exonuclease/phosphatase family metal-dependent hydrolase
MLLLTLVLMLGLAPQSHTPEAIRVVSFNIRFDNPADGPDAWPHRRDAVASFLRFHEADIVGVQEALHHQNVELDERLPDHDWIGVGRDDGMTGGEYSSIFFRKARFDIIDWGTTWLSEAPSDTGSIGWDAAITRVLTWATVRDKHTDRHLRVYNTHYDHVGSIARKESSRLILEHIKDTAGELPVLLMGDLNVNPTEEAARLLMSEPSRLRDAIDLAAIPHYGPRSTWNAFREIAPDRRIDFIAVSEEFTVRRHAILTDTIDGRFLSDHLPVFAEIALR